MIDKSTSLTPRAGHEVIVAVKTNSSWFPDKAIEEKMKDWPSGSCLVMETTAPETGVKLMAIGHRHNSRKTLCFVFTKDAGSASPGTPHKASFPDQCGNICQRSVSRPAILSFHFSTSSPIDSHNHMRQHSLALERHWKTPNPWLRTVTSIIGTTVIDAMKALRHCLPQLHAKMTVEEFADRLAFDCCHNGFPRSTTGASQVDIAADGMAAADRSQALPNVLLRLLETLNDSLHNVTVSCCGVSGNPSPLTADGSIFGFGSKASV